MASRSQFAAVPLLSATAQRGHDLRVVPWMTAVPGGCVLKRGPEADQCCFSQTSGDELEGYRQTIWAESIG